MANSSMLVLPRITRPASRSLRDDGRVVRRHPPAQDPAAAGRGQAPGHHHVLDGDRARRRARQPAPRGRGAASTRAASASARSPATCRKAWTPCRGPPRLVTVAVDDGDAVEVRARHLDGRHLAGTERAGEFGGGAPREIGARVGHVSPPRGCAAPGTAARPPRARPRAPPRGVRLGRGSSGRVTFVSGIGCDVAGTSSPASSLHRRHGLEDPVELAGEPVELVGAQVDARQRGEVRDVVARDGGHGSPGGTARRVREAARGDGPRERPLSVWRSGAARPRGHGWTKR